MNLTVRIPDDLAHRLTSAGADIERRALEALVLEEFRAGRMTKGELRRALGFEVLNEVDGFLKAHGAYEPVTLADIKRDLQDSEALDRQDAPDNLVARFRTFAAGHTLGGLDVRELISEGRQSLA